MTISIKRKSSIYYIDNKRFYAEMQKYIAACKEAEECGDEYPIIPNYIGECFYKIASKLSSKPNFSGYTYKEDMIGDAIETCVKYVKSFNPEKSVNPFSYFTQIVSNAFLHRIHKEKKQQYVKYKSMENMLMHNENYSSQDSDSMLVLTPDVFENSNKIIASFEDTIQKSKKKKEDKLAERKALEEFIDLEDTENET